MEPHGEPNLRGHSSSVRPTGRLLPRLASLRPSSRPAWAMMPEAAGTPFGELLLFVCAALDHLGVEHVIHYGSLLGAARLGGPLPWDEDHDLFVIDTDLYRLRRHLEPILTAHGYRVSRDKRGFLWIKERFWSAGAGHLALDVLPPPVAAPDPLPVWEGGAPHLAQGELYPLRPLPFCGSFVWAPAAHEAVISRLYGEAGGEAAFTRFSAPPFSPRSRAFWTAARQPERMDWPAISRRFQGRSRVRPLFGTPWWWFNGLYILGINAVKRWALPKLS